MAKTNITVANGVKANGTKPSKLGFLANELLTNTKQGLSNAWGTTKTGVGNLAGYAAAHPFMTAGLGLTGAANIGGLFDNDKIGGQLIGGAGAGLAGHYLLPKLLGHAVSPQAQVLMGLGGGALGSLFDKLRQNKEDQYTAQLNAIQQNTQRGVY
jgi:hypothetical protein